MTAAEAPGERSMTAAAATVSLLVEEAPTGVCSPPEAAKSAPGEEDDQ